MKTMTLDEMRLKVCEKLPEVIRFTPIGSPVWSKHDAPVFWPTEGLQVCHEAEKLLTKHQWDRYVDTYEFIIGYGNCDSRMQMHATYEQRLEALTRVWFPERWQ